MKKLTMNVQRAIRPDAQTFDEITIRVIPRFKISSVSSDEWRIAANIEFKRKGETLDEVALSDMRTAVAYLPYLFDDAIVRIAEVSFAGVTDENGAPLCDQEGCSARATVVYKQVLEACRRCGESKQVQHDLFGSYKPVVRMFCLRHAVRGDANLDDRDSNYELLEERCSISEIEMEELKKRREAYIR